MITLHGFGARAGLPDASPFVLKVDAFLRLAGLPFKRVSGIQNMRKAPKGKLPFIVDDNQLVADSSIIVRHLQDKHKLQIDNHLNETQKATAYALQSMLEEKAYWCTLYFRWVDDAGWAQVKPLFFGDMPAPLKWFVPTLVRRGTRDAVFKQGTGRHGPDTVLAMAGECLACASALIGEGPYLFGDKPCSTDATLYGFLAQTTLADIDTPVNKLASDFPNLKRYCENFRDTYYADS